MSSKRLTPEFAPGEAPSVDALVELLRPYKALISALPFLFFASESIAAFFLRRSFADTDFLLKMVFGQLLAINSFLAGLAHFVPALHQMYTSMIFLPFKRFWLYSTGFLLMFAGVGVTFATTQVVSAWTLAALFVAMFPANVACVFQPYPRKIVFGGSVVKALMRLPFQFFFIHWALWFTSPPLSIPW